MQRNHKTSCPTLYKHKKAKHQKRKFSFIYFYFHWNVKKIWSYHFSRQNLFVFFPFSYFFYLPFHREKENICLDISVFTFFVRHFPAINTTVGSSQLDHPSEILHLSPYLDLYLNWFLFLCHFSFVFLSQVSGFDFSVSLLQEVFFQLFMRLKKINN